MRNWGLLPSFASQARGSGPMGPPLRAGGGQQGPPALKGGMALSNKRAQTCDSHPDTRESENMTQTEVARHSSMCDL